MAQVGPVVLVEVVEGQVDDVEHDEPQRDGHHEESADHGFVADGHVEPEGHAI